MRELYDGKRFYQERRKEMWNKFTRALRNLHHDQKGMTGLETAIILIAFVTVASVLAYSVLTAGVFSAERGKEAVFQGLQSARTTLETRGCILATCSDNVSDNSSADHIIFNLACVLPGEEVDMTAPPDNVVVINYIDDSVHVEDVTWTATLLGEERGAANILEDDEVMKVDITVPDSATVDAYHDFTLQIIPPNGTAIIIRRTMGSALYMVNNLN